MENSPNLKRILASYVLVTLTLIGILFLHNEFPGLFYVKNVVASLGGGAAIYYVFCSRSYFSSVTTLYSFFMASCVLLSLTDFLRDPELSSLVLIGLSSSFFFSFFLNSNRNLDTIFLVISCGFLTLIGLGWSISFLVEFCVLFFFDFLRKSHIKKKKVLLSFILLLLLCFSFYFIGVHPGFRIGVVFLFGTAGAGGLLFLCLNKTEWEQASGFFIYFLTNVLLGFFLKKEGETFPKITVFFLMILCCFFLLVYLVSRVKEESLSAVITGSKTLLRGVFFPFLYFLNDVFFGGAYFLWISSFVIHVLILLLFKLILQNEDQDPILENEEKG